MTTSTTSIVLWTARILGTLIVVFTLIIGIGEILEGINKATSEPFDTLTIITFVIGGLGLAGLIFWKEGTGGIISLVSFIISIFLVAINPKSSFTYVLFIFLIPSVLYIYY